MNLIDKMMMESMGISEKDIVMGFAVCEFFRSIDDGDVVMAMLMATLDKWAKAHNVSAEELEGMMAESMEIMHEVHEEHGL